MDMNGQAAGRLTRASLVVLGFSPDLELKVSLELQQGPRHSFGTARLLSIASCFREREE